MEWFLGTTLGAVALSIVYPVFRFVIPPEVAESVTSRVLAGTLSAMPSNSGKVFRFGAKPALLIRLPNGDLRAFTAICTHLGCTVEYRADLPANARCPPFSIASHNSVKLGRSRAKSSSGR